MRVSRDLDWGATSTIGDAVTYAVLVRLRKTLCAVSPPPRLRAPIPAPQSLAHAHPC